MADEQTTQATQEQGGAQTAGGDPTTSTQSFAQNIPNYISPESIVRKTAEPEAENKLEKPAEKTFTQAELNKIIAERQKRWEKKAADEKAEAERVAAMTADEKSKHEREKQEKALADREAALTKRERTALAKEYLAEKNVPAALVVAVDISDPDGIEASAAAVAKAFTDAVSAEVAKKLAGAPPKKGDPGAKDPFLDGLGV